MFSLMYQKKILDQMLLFQNILFFQLYYKNVFEYENPLYTIIND